MKVYPLLAVLSKAESKDAAMGMLLGMNPKENRPPDEYSEKMKLAAQLLERSESVAAFLEVAKKRDL